MFRHIYIVVLLLACFSFVGCQSAMFSDDQKERIAAVDEISNERELARIAMDYHCTNISLMFNSVQRNLPMDVRLRALDHVTDVQLLAALATFSIKSHSYSSQNSYCKFTLGDSHPEIRERALKRLTTLDGYSLLMARKMSSFENTNLLKNLVRDINLNCDISNVEISAPSTFVESWTQAVATQENLVIDLFITYVMNDKNLDFNLIEFILENPATNRIYIVDNKKQPWGQHCIFKALPKTLNEEMSKQLNNALLANFDHLSGEDLVTLLRLLPQNYTIRNDVAVAILTKVGAEATSIQQLHTYCEILEPYGIDKSQKDEIVTASLKRLMSTISVQERDDRVAYAAHHGDLELLKIASDVLEFDALYTLNYKRTTMAAPSLIGFAAMDYFTNEIENRGHTLLELALLGGHSEVATFLYDSGAKDPRISNDKIGFWMNLCKSAKAIDSIEWLIQQKLLTAQEAYTSVLCRFDVSLAKQIKAKYPAVKCQLLLATYFANITPYDTSTKCIETVDYLVENGVLIDDPIKRYSSVASIANTLWTHQFLMYRGRQGTCLTLGDVIKHLVEKHQANVSQYCFKGVQKWSDDDVIRLDEYTRLAMLSPMLIAEHQEEMGLNATEMNNLIKKLEHVHSVVDAAMRGELDGAVNYELAEDAVSFVFASMATGEAVTSESMKRLPIRTYIENALLKAGTITWVERVKFKATPLVPIALLSEIEDYEVIPLLELMIERGAPLPCVVQTEKGTFHIVNGTNDDLTLLTEKKRKPSNKVCNYLRAAERKAERKMKASAEQ